MEQDPIRMKLTRRTPEQRQDDEKRRLDPFLRALKAIHTAATPEVMDVEDLREEDEPPTILSNNGFSDCVEGVLESYGLPHRGEFDPTTIMSFFYVFFFGMMLSDAAYGLARQLEDVLSEITFAPVEFTVEAGRPDTIDGEKLRVLKDHGVHRISVNPQTFNQSVLDAVGRKHTVQAIYDSFGIEAGFAVNMDLIAGLPTETYEMFCHSVDCAVGLQPENLTVHTLALKHGTALKEQRYATDGDVEKMVEYAHSQARAQGYLPYYMYRQKYMSQNLENVGFCKEGRQCLYNIGMMEEVTDILACGANAISKKISAAENRIERAANAKDVITYVQRIDDYMQKKFALFEA